MNFQILDFDFSDAIEFITGISHQAQLALLNNTMLTVHIAFVDDDIVDFGMLYGLLEWLEVCDAVNRQIRANAYNGVRIPWKYYADGTLYLLEFCYRG